MGRETAGPQAWVDDADGRRVGIDDGAAVVIRRLFAEYATGRYSSRSLAHRLNAEGATLLSNTGPRDLRGKGWHGDTVMHVLSNVAYIGKTYSISRDKRQGELIDAKWPSLIDQETWEAIQRQRARHRRPSGRIRVGMEGRQYVFQGLLRCVCGRRMWAVTDGGTAYYRCGGFDAPDRCRAGMIREQRLLPWARGVIERLDSKAPADLAERAEALACQPKTAPSALANVEESLRRADFMFFSVKRWDQEQYRAEVERLTRIRDELARELLPERPPLLFTGVLAAWDGGDSVTRRELLGQLFDALDVENGEIVRYMPRSDRAAEIARLMEYLLAAEGEGFEPPRAWRPLRFSRWPVVSP